MATQASEVRAQNVTLESATRHHARWTVSELKALDARHSAGTRSMDTALELHRTMYAVRSAVHTLSERLAKAPVRTSKDVVLPYDLGFTSLAEMGF